MKTPTLTLPDLSPADSARISTLKRNIKDLAWTGNQGADRFHFCFRSAADRRIAKRRLSQIEA